MLICGGSVMAKSFKTVYIGRQGEITEKKSRFIATVRHVESEEEVQAFLEETRKKYWDARHNCYAFTIGKNREQTRCSDDGEPSGTAGRPILDVLTGADLHDTAIVVTRYFGGVLLGTGGLVRAYSQAAKAGVEASTVIEKKEGVLLRVVTDYQGYGKLRYMAEEREVCIYDTEFTEKVDLILLVPEERSREIQEAVTDLSGGKASAEIEKKLCFAMVDGKAEIFEDL